MSDMKSPLLFSYASDEEDGSGEDDDDAASSSRCGNKWFYMTAWPLFSKKKMNQSFLLINIKILLILLLIMYSTFP